MEYETIKMTKNNKME